MLDGKATGYKFAAGGYNGTYVRATQIDDKIENPFKHLYPEKKDDMNDQTVILEMKTSSAMGGGNESEKKK